jgi:hypothetical protein
MDFQIYPFEVVNDIKFGMTAAQVRALMPARSEPFHRGAAVGHPSDHFQDLGAFAYYDDDGRLEALEFAEPARPIVRRVNLLDLPYADARAELAELGGQLQDDDSGVIARNIGLGLYAPDAVEDPEERAEAVIAFVKGYYD